MRKGRGKDDHRSIMMINQSNQRETFDPNSDSQKTLYREYLMPIWIFAGPRIPVHGLKKLSSFFVEPSPDSRLEKTGSQNHVRGGVQQKSHSLFYRRRLAEWMFFTDLQILPRRQQAREQVSELAKKIHCQEIWPSLKFAFGGWNYRRPGNSAPKRRRLTKQLPSVTHQLSSTIFPGCLRFGACPSSWRSDAVRTSSWDFWRPSLTVLCEARGCEWARECIKDPCKRRYSDL